MLLISDTGFLFFLYLHCSRNKSSTYYFFILLIHSTKIGTVQSAESSLSMWRQDHLTWSKFSKATLNFSHMAVIVPCLLALQLFLRFLQRVGSMAKISSLGIARCTR